MIAYLNGFPMSDGSNGVWLNVELDGFELPTVRTSSGNYAGRDGGYIGAQFFSARDITIQGTVFSSSVSVLESSRSALQTALLADRANNLTPVTIQLITNAGNNYTVYAYLLDFQMPIKQAIWSAPFKIELLAPDPTIYLTNTTSLPANLPLVTTAGIPYPLTYPWTYPAEGLPATINNSGTVAVYPIITLTGLATDPVITNVTTGQTFSLNLVTAPTDSIVINMQQRSVLLNGSSVLGDVVSGSSWLYLQPGNNQLSLTSAGGGDTVSGTVAWQSGVMGI
jgi:hypothetical protein